VAGSYQANKKQVAIRSEPEIFRDKTKMETSGLVAFIGTALAIACLRPLSAKLQLVDLPNQCKQHVGAIPLIGQGGSTLC
jgi:hypothetical protein